MKKEVSNIPFDIAVEHITKETSLRCNEVIRACLWLMLRSKGKHMLAHVHALMHVDPKIALMNGFPSLNSSAKECGVSREYIRKLRDKYKQEFKL